MGKTAEGIITIKGLQAGEVDGVNRILFSLPGLSQAAANTATGRVRLEYEPARYGLLTAVMLLRQAGFPAVVGEYG
ncbi:MAG: hypothetical protein ACOX8W_02605 [bacterium]|jgi:hypothetical protein